MKTKRRPAPAVNARPDTRVRRNGNRPDPTAARRVLRARRRRSWALLAPWGVAACAVQKTGDEAACPFYKRPSDERGGCGYYRQLSEVDRNELAPCVRSRGALDTAAGELQGAGMSPALSYTVAAALLRASQGEDGGKALSEALKVLGQFSIESLRLAHKNGEQADDTAAIRAERRARYAAPAPSESASPALVTGPDQNPLG